MSGAITKNSTLLVDSTVLDPIGGDDNEVITDKISTNKWTKCCLYVETQSDATNDTETGIELYVQTGMAKADEPDGVLWAATESDITDALDVPELDSDELQRIVSAHDWKIETHGEFMRFRMKNKDADNPYTVRIYASI